MSLLGSIVLWYREKGLELPENIHRMVTNVRPEVYEMRTETWPMPHNPRNDVVVESYFFKWLCSTENCDNPYRVAAIYHYLGYEGFRVGQDRLWRGDLEQLKCIYDHWAWLMWSKHSHWGIPHEQQSRISQLLCHKDVLEPGRNPIHDSGWIPS